jgi:pimeloyl-ACP methyl ester carboxylesterase
MSAVLRRLVSAAAATTTFLSGTSLGRYRSEMREIRERVRNGGRIAETARGPIEYGVEGAGVPVLLIHGAAGGYDQGLLLARAFAPAGVQVIAPSRFGYLGTPLPEDASPTAQARALAALLDCLAIERAIVIGVSAGAPSAVEMALHHPQRVRGLVLAVPRGYAPDMPTLPLRRSSLMVLRLILSSDLAYWSALRLAGDRMVRRMGVPPNLLTGSTLEERARVIEMMRSVLPVGPRIPGLRNDLATKLRPLPLESIEVSTLIIASRDDLFDTLAAGQFMADRMRDARLLVFDRGGHLLVGRRQEVTAAIAAFLAPLQEAKETDS